MGKWVVMGYIMGFGVQKGLGFIRPKKAGEGLVCGEIFFEEDWTLLFGVLSRWDLVDTGTIWAA